MLVHEAASSGHGSCNGEAADLTPADFFISYTGVDESWAVWIAWILEDAGHSVIIQSWDFRPGHNFVLMMEHATSASNRTIIVLTPAFLEAMYTQGEWAAAFSDDPTGMARKLIPVCVEPCRLDGLLKQIIYVDLVEIGDEDEAARTLLRGVAEGRAKPSEKPPFPVSQFPNARLLGSTFDDSPEGQEE